ncbi:MAG: translational GTPase TypA [Pseudomonadales bacterium]|nr:translational GTPase TypA [Pseudomonadales bacterium]
MMHAKNLRNIAIIAHVDHGKTTLVDKLLQQTGTLDARAPVQDRVMDSNELEQERGITILSKTTAVDFGDYRINIVDTPGHADFGGEVERILSMVDSVLLLVDAVDGPMPQTRFVTQKAFAEGLHPIVVINKIDRPGADPFRVLDEVFELFDNLGATDEQLDFPVIYASALQGHAGLEPEAQAEDMQPLLDSIVANVLPPEVDAEGPFQMQISSLDYSSYVGVIGIGRVKRGNLRANSPVSVVNPDGVVRRAKVLLIMGHKGLERLEQEYAEAGDIVCITGIADLGISDTVCEVNNPEGIEALSVDEPTVSMLFRVNTSPLAGQDGKFLTSRQIKDRLEREVSHNVALRVEMMPDPDQFLVSGRGELHLSILIETMRREGYELAISRPQVIMKEVDGKKQEPYELLTLDVEEIHQGKVMEELGDRRAELVDMQPDGKGRVRLSYTIATRALMGFRSLFLSLTSGTGVMSYAFEGYGAEIQAVLGQRNNGVMINNGNGAAVGFALFALQNRGRMMVSPGTQVYEGMVVGIHQRDNDLVVNGMKEKQLTNVRASGTDEAIKLNAPIIMTLEQSMEFINDDELVEITPDNIRIRKIHLKEHERKTASRSTPR